MLPGLQTGHRLVPQGVLGWVLGLIAAQVGYQPAVHHQIVGDAP